MRWLVIAPQLGPLMDEQTSIVSAVNLGVLVVFFTTPIQGLCLMTKPLDAVDPGAVIWNSWGPERAIGCVVYPACEIAEPGLIRHLDGDNFPWVSHQVSELIG